MGLRRLHYAWVVVAITFLTVLMTAGMRAAPGVLIVPLQDAFGWSRATISAAVGANILVLGMMGPFAAAIMDRFGIRRMMVASLLLMALGMGGSALVTQAWQLIVLWGGVTGVGMGLCFMVLGPQVASRWFASRRGLVIGILTAATATGQLLLLPAFAALESRLGWQAVVLSAAGIACALAIPVALLMRDRPADMGLRPYGQVGPVAPPASAAHPFRRALLVLRDAASSRDFWLIGGSYFVCGASTSGLIGTHLIPACVDEGISPVVGASLLAGMGALNIVGATFSGWLTDRIDARVLLAWYFGLRGLSLLALAYVFQYDLLGLTGFAVFYGLDWIATAPPIVRLTARRFGEENVGMYFGWISALHQIGGAGVAYSAGLLRGATGDYQASFMISGLLCLGASIAVTWIRGGGLVARPGPAPLAAAE